MSRRHPYLSAALRRWDEDWRRLVAAPSTAQAVHRWGDDHRLGGAPDLPSLLRAAGAAAASPTPEADVALGALVERAAQDVLAARIVLQRVLPGLMAVARRREPASPRAMTRALDDLVATAWLVIVTYPVARRPAKYAANIVRDCEYLVFVRPRRLRRVEEW